MKLICKILFLFFITSSIVGCKNFTDSKNGLIGKVYADKKEIEEFNGYEKIGGAIIDNVQDKPQSYEYGISHLLGNKKNILIFEKIIRNPDNNKLKYEILDTINIDNIGNGQYITFSHCMQDSAYAPQIIALVVSDEEKEFHNRVVKAWSANIETQKIIPVNTTVGIKCNEEGYDEDTDE